MKAPEGSKFAIFKAKADGKLHALETPADVSEADVIRSAERANDLFPDQAKTFVEFKSEVSKPEVDVILTVEDALMEMLSKMGEMN